MILADGPVIPSPNSRPVATLSGQAASAINPINTAEKNGCQRFSNNKWASPVFFGFNAATFTLGLLRCLYTQKAVTKVNNVTNHQGEMPNVS